MKKFERTLLLVIIFHFVCLLFIQTVFHHFHLFPHLNEVAKYEGVNQQLHNKIWEAQSHVHQ